MDGRLAYNSVDGAIEPPVSGWRRRQGGYTVEPPVSGWMRQPGWRTVQASLTTDPLDDYRTNRAKAKAKAEAEEAKAKVAGGYGAPSASPSASAYFDPSLRGVGISI